LAFSAKKKDTKRKIILPHSS